MEEKEITVSGKHRELPVKEETAAKKEKKKKKAKKDEIKPVKRLFCYANIVYSAIAFGLIAVGLLVLPHSTISEIEQRELAKFPTFSPEEFANGKYTNGITDYYNDTVPYRDDLKKAAANLRSLFGVSLGDAEIIGPVALITEDEEEEPVIIPEPVTATAPTQTTPPESQPDITNDKTESTTEQSVTSPPETTPPETTTEKPAETKKNLNEIADGVRTNGQVVTKLSDGHWWGISLYGGGKGTTYASVLNAFKEQLGDSVNVYSMVVPTSGEYYLPDSYNQYSASHQKSIDSIDSQLVGVISVPASKIMWEHIDENIYLRTDHHWQPLGAYYAAKCFAETAGVPFADLSTMETIQVEGYMGTMYGFTENANLLSDPEVFTYYKPSNDFSTYYYDRAYNYDYNLPFFIPMPTNSSYSIFMAGDDKIVRIKTDAGTGRKLVIFKDSYGNAEVPFYFGSFDEIYVCDMRYFSLNPVQFVKFTGATDLLCTMCTFSAVGGNAETFAKIFSNPVTEITETVP